MVDKNVEALDEVLAVLVESTKVNFDGTNISYKPTKEVLPIEEDLPFTPFKDSKGGYTPTIIALRPDGTLVQDCIGRVFETDSLARDLSDKISKEIENLADNTSEYPNVLGYKTDVQYFYIH